MEKAENTKRFPETTAGFLKKLSAHNEKEWFEAHREEFEEKLRVPAVEFVQSLGSKLRKIVPDVHADPRTDKSIFRLHRDTRFSKNKNPYKTNLGILFWEGARKRMECSGFYFHVEPGKLMLAAGMYLFAKDQLAAYREAVDGAETGKRLDKLLRSFDKKGYQKGTRHYKRVPRGYDPESRNADLLLFNGLYVYKNYSMEEIGEVKDFEKFVFTVFKEMLPLHQWLIENIPHTRKS